MSVMSVLDVDGMNLEKDSTKVAYFLDDFFKFCSDRLVVLYNGDSCKYIVLLASKIIWWGYIFVI